MWFICVVFITYIGLLIESAMWLNFASWLNELSKI